MTRAAHARRHRTNPASSDVPDADTPILVNRPVRPGTDPVTLSRFGEDRWNLTPGIFEGQIHKISLNFTLVPDTFRYIAKRYIWLELNHDQELPVLRRASVTTRLAVYTMLSQLRMVRGLMDWLDQRGIPSLAAVAAEHLDQYLDTVRAAEIRSGARSDLLQAVRRLWAFRDLLPPEGRLPETPPWGGKDTRVLLGRSTYERENRTPRIPEATMNMLLCWALRMVETFGDDILAAIREYRGLVGRYHRRAQVDTTSRHAKMAWLADHIDALLDQHRDSGEPLPGRVLADGSREPDWAHLGRLIDCRYQLLEREGPWRQRILQAGIPIDDNTYLRTRPGGLLDGQTWLSRIRYDHIPAMARALNTACFLLITYLSGARPGEVLNLERGCISRNPATGLWELAGRKWKNATDAHGAKIPEGQQRDDPWIVVEPVARAVAVVEQLHDAPLLFPVAILDHRSTDRDGARSYSSINADLNHFVDWVDTYCRDRHRGDPIPNNAASRLKASQLRRTLAWFICRRPRGLVAAAIQYGHLHVQVTQGYAGNYASGFPDDLAFERWLARLDELDDADRRLHQGDHVSGPAADAYRSRITGGATRFAGRVIRTGRQARHILANPSLQIHHGKAMTCVFNADTALCELQPSTDDARHTPDADDCRPNCRNIAYTEDNITALRAEATALQRIVDDPVSPPLRLARERHRLNRITTIIADHDTTKARKDGDQQP